MNNLEKKERIMNNRDPVIQLPPPSFSVGTYISHQLF